MPHRSETLPLQARNRIVMSSSIRTRLGAAAIPIPGVQEPIVEHDLNQQLPRLDGTKIISDFPGQFGIDLWPMRPTPELAVDLDCLRVQNGKGSKAKVVLKDLYLTLPKGKIYGLLGPSGCGKTTLLQCICGRKNPQKGLVRVLGQRPGEPGSLIPGPGVGYMPQELTLYPELTIYETLHFFGELSGMPETLIRQRIEALLELLELPFRTRLVGCLSGGQQRRVSLACALIHSPPLLILDEPTVGLDPLLIKKIWDHLLALARDEGVSVLITTHHMEEVRGADLVGFMRSGRMLAQDSPDQLLEQSGCENLGDMFLQLCIADREGHIIVKPEGMPEVVGQKPTDCTVIAAEEVPAFGLPLEVMRTVLPETKINGPTTKGKRGGNFLGRVYALVMKNLLQTRRNIPLLLFALFTPSLHMLLFGNSIGGDPFELPVAVVNDDVHPILSQPFLESIPNYTIVQRPYADLNQALNSLKRGETWGVLEIGHNFSTALQYRFLLGIDTDKHTIDESTMNIYIDSTNQQIKFMLQKTIFESLITFYEKLLSKNNKHIALAQLPIKIKDPFYGNQDLSATGFMAPGIILSITFFMAMALTAVSTTREAREGTMERCLVAGVKSYEVILSHVLSQVCIMLVQMSLMLVVVFALFKIPLQGSFLLVLLLTSLQGLSGMTYGLAISSVCTQEQTAIFLALATFIANLLVSGIIWTIQSMPEVLRQVAYVLPQTVPTESLRCIMYRGWGMERHEVFLGFAISIVWPCFFLLFAFAFFKSQRHR